MEIELGLHRTHWMASKETEVFHVVRFNFWYEAWEYTCQGDGDYEPKLEHVEGQPVLCKTCFDEWVRISGIQEAYASEAILHDLHSRYVIQETEGRE